MYKQPETIILRARDNDGQQKYVETSNSIVKLIHDREHYSRKNKSQRGYIYTYELSESIVQKASIPLPICSECEDSYDKFICESCNMKAHERYKWIDISLEETDDLEIIGVVIAYQRVDDVSDIMAYGIDSWGDYYFKRVINNKTENMGGGFSLDFANKRADRVLSAIAQNYMEIINTNILNNC